MRRWIAVCAIGLICLTVIMFRHPVAEGIPLSPNALTQERVSKVVLKFHQRTIVDAYKEYGIHNPKWDSAAKQFLDEYAESCVTKKDGDQYSRIAEDGNAVIQMGCTDPMVESCLGIRLCTSGKLQEGLSLLRKSMEGFTNSNYPKWRARLNPIYIIKYNGVHSKKESEQLSELAVKWTVDCFSDGSFQPGDDQAIAETGLKNAYEPAFAGYWDELCNKLQASKNQFQYASLVFCGDAMIKAAWEARGSGWASTVSDKKWDVFGADIKKARDFLTQAWKEHPEYPYAPSYMITVAMAESSEKEMKTWFDRAVTAEIDYNPAYENYIWGIYPRWIGSHEMMYNFGVECLKTKRYDTCVPSYLLEILFDIEKDSNGNDFYFRLPQTGKYLNEFYDDSAKIEKNPMKRAKILSEKAAMAWYCGRYTDAKATIKNLGQSFDPQVFKSAINTPYEEVKPELDVYDETTAAQIQKADLSADSGNYAAAYIICKNLLVSNKINKAAKPYIQKRCVKYGMSRDFENGKWVSFRPSPQFDGFNKMCGKFTIAKDGAIEAKPQNGFFVLLADLDSGIDWEMTGDMEFIPDDQSHLDAGIIWNPCDYTSNTILISHDQGKAQIYGSGNKNISAPLKIQVKKKFHFDVLMNMTCIKFFIDGQPCISNSAPQVSQEDQIPKLGILGICKDPNTVVRFSNVRFKKL